MSIIRIFSDKRVVNKLQDIVIVVLLLLCIILLISLYRENNKELEITHTEDRTFIEYLIKENVELKRLLDSNKIKEKYEIHNINNLSDSVILRKLSKRYGY